MLKMGETERREDRERRRTECVLIRTPQCAGERAKGDRSEFIMYNCNVNTHTHTACNKIT